MKRTLFSFILTILFLSATTAVNAQNSARARQILDKASAAVMRPGGASANFTMSSQNIGSASGTVSIKGNKFFASTPNIKVWNNGSTQWTYVRSTNEVTIIKPNDAQQMSANPYRFVSIYKSGYVLSMKEVGGKYQVHLTAIHPGRSIPEAYITVNRNYQPTQIRMRQGKTWTTISVSNFRARNISNGTFEFNKKAYPSAEVVDLR